MLAFDEHATRPRGVGANRELRELLTREVEVRGANVYFPDLVFCTDNGAMIALAGAMRLVTQKKKRANSG